ncbi:MAG: merR family regulatory protein [Schlesneria sp.]|nr:merR family regulatory protein [Schlesneria sp.]
MNDQELPEDGTHLDPAAQMHVADIETDEDLEENLDEEFSDEELAEVDPDEFEDDEELEATRSMIDELFDEDDLGEVMSELDVLTLEDAAAYLKVEYGQIRRLVKEQGLPGRKIGEDWRFLRGAIADWLSEPTGTAATPAPAPVQEKRQEFTARPPLKERFAQGADQDRPPRFPQQGGSRYPQQGQGNNRYPQQGGQQESRPPRRNEGGYQGGGQNQGSGHNQGGNQFQGGNQGGNRNQEGYPPPRRPAYGNNQGQQFPQGEYRPPRRGNFENQGGAGGNAGGGGGQFSGGQFSGAKKFDGPKKPKRKALNEQRFKRLDRRKFDGEEGGAAPQDSQD